MQNVFIGEYIRQRRKELHLTQEELCYGICEASTLSRIENGRHTPCRSKITALLQRLGLPDERFYALASKNELEIETLKKEIINCNASKETEKAAEYLRKLESIVEQGDHLTQQFILRTKALICKEDHSAPPEEQLSMLLQAIRLTQPDFTLESVEQFLYTQDELKIINQIALLHASLQHYSVALEIHGRLVAYLEKHAQESIINGNILQLVLYNYARELGLNQQYEQGIAVAEKGRKTCIHYGHYHCLPGFFAVEAECFYYLDQMQQSADCYRQAFYLYKALEQPRDLAIIRQEALEHLGLDLED